jgi:hypothetical protein
MKIFTFHWLTGITKLLPTGAPKMEFFNPLFIKKKKKKKKKNSYQYTKSISIKLVTNVIAH